MVVAQGRRPPHRRRGARPLVWLALALIGLAAAFALGKAVGDGPSPAGTQTIERSVRLVTVTVKR
jgi:hypothetical protein